MSAFGNKYIIPRQPKITMTKGIPGSGKSTWAKLQVGDGDTIIISNDDLRVMFNNKLWQENSKIRDKTEKFVANAKETLIDLALSQNLNVIVDATHISKKYETRMRELFGKKAEIVIKDFTDVPIEDCIKNDLKRPNSVGSKVIYEMYGKLHPQTTISPIQENTSLESAIIVDMDGTLANIDWRDPYDAKDCDLDGIYQDVADLVMDTLKTHSNWKLIILSGRMEQFRWPTLKWLNNNQIPFDFLYMRENNDYRKDSIIKQEIYEQNIKDKYNVKFILDDRKQVVDMWRSLGLRCLQVQAGDF